MSSDSTRKSCSGDKRGNRHLRSKVDNLDAWTKALETAMWNLQVQPGLESRLESTEQKLGVDRSVATWDNWTESSESGDTVRPEPSPSGTSHDAIQQPSASTAVAESSSQVSFFEHPNPHSTRSINDRLLHNCIQD